MIITFCTKKYFELSKGLARSVIKFTDFEISIFTYGFSTNEFIHDRVKIVNTENSDNNDWTNNLYYKFLTCYNSPYDKTFYLDSDIIVTKTFNKWILDEFIKFTNISNNLLFGCRHPTNPSFGKNKFVDELSITFKEMEVEKVKNYIFGAAFGFDKTFKHHFNNMYEYSKRVKKPITGDEAILNAYLTKYNLDYDCGYDFIPNWCLFDDFIKNTLDSNVEIQRGLYKHRKVLPVLFHGNKDHNYIDTAIKMIEGHSPLDRA